MEIISQDYQFLVGMLLQICVDEIFLASHHQGISLMPSLTILLQDHVCAHLSCLSTCPMDADLLREFEIASISPDSIFSIASALMSHKQDYLARNMTLNIN